MLWAHDEEWCLDLVFRWNTKYQTPKVIVDSREDNSREENWVLLVDLLLVWVSEQ